MKSLLLLALVTILCVCSTHAQTTDQNPMRLYAKGGHVYLDWDRMKPKEVKKMLAASPEALSQYKSGKTISGFNVVVSTVAGACIGWELGNYLSTGSIDGVPLAVGGGLLGVSIALQLIANKQVAKSIELYKNSNETASVNLRYGLVGSGVGIAMTF